MCDLVGNHVGQALVTGQQGRGHECQTGVLHATVGEGGGQAEHVVSAPGVGAVSDLLCIP